MPNGSPLSLRKLDNNLENKKKDDSKKNGDVIEEVDGEQHEEKSD